MSGFDVDIEQLRWHATTIASIADQLSGVSGRAPESVTDGALGSFAQFLTAGLSAAVGQASGAIGEAAATADTMSVALRRAAEAYQRSDDDSSSHLVREYER